MLKFKIDENLPVEIKQLLNEAGHDAMTVFDQKLSGESDSAVFTICKNERRCLITLDLDFSDIRNYPLGQHSGIVVMRTADQSKEVMLQLFSDHIYLFSIEPVHGRLWIIEKDRVRVRG